MRPTTRAGPPGQDHQCVQKGFASAGHVNSVSINLRKPGSTRPPAEVVGIGSRNGRWTALILVPMRWLALKTSMILLLQLGTAAAAGPSDDEIRQMLINASIAAYPGNCACPYNVDRGGRRCGARSAYSKAGGYGPLCFAGDVTDKMVADHRGLR